MWPQAFLDVVAWQPFPNVLHYVTIPLAKSALHALPWWEDTQASPVVCPFPNVCLPLLYLVLKEPLSITPLMKYCQLLGHLCSPHSEVCYPLCSHCDPGNTAPATFGSDPLLSFYSDVPGSTGAWPLYTCCLQIHTEQMMMGKTKVLISTYTLAGTKMSMCQCGKAEKTNKWKPKCSKEKIRSPNY